MKRGGGKKREPRRSRWGRGELCFQLMYYSSTAPAPRTRGRRPRHRTGGEMRGGKREREKERRREEGREGREEKEARAAGAGCVRP